MSRSSKKGPYVDERLMKRVLAAKEAGTRTPLKTWARSSNIAPEMVGMIIAVHSGKEHVPVHITESMVGHKLGEFAPTRKFKGHGGRMAKEQARAAVAATQEQPASPATK